MTSLTQRKIFLIDNFDSFTYNLVNQIRPMVDELEVYRNDISFRKMTDIIDACKSEKLIVLSPGPGNPGSAGNTLKIIERYQGQHPILGICLGHQAIIQSFNGIIGSAKAIVHGKAEPIQLIDKETSLFRNLANPFIAARYHSLAATSIPSCLKVIAKTEDEVMAVRHSQHKILGYQFHPESILTPQGGALLKNSIDWLLD